MPQEILEFWFSDEARKLWFKSTSAFDDLCRQRFLGVWEQACRGELDQWMETADGCLALVIILDQFPLNMFRGDARSFASEARSRDVARHALDRNFDRDMTTEQRAFLYMPFMHSEVLEDQDLALQLFDQPGLESNLRFARHHHDIVRRFGRFPHRNEALGRDSTSAEREYLNSREAFTG